MILSRGQYLRRPKQLIDDPTIQQMLALGAPPVPVHQLLHQVRTHTTRIAHNILGNLKRPRQHLLGLLTHVRKQAVPHLVRRRIRAARRHRLHGARVPDQPRQIERRARLHDDAAPRKYKPDFRARRCNPDVHWQRHGDADAYGGTLDRGDAGFAAVMDGEGYAAASG